MTMHIVHKRGFTLLELMVATALTLIIVTAATTAINQMLKMVRRVQALQNMNSAAALVHNRLNRQVSSMHPCTAVWLHQDSSDTSVELVFMHGLENSGTPMFNTDQRWTRWHWSGATGVLGIAEGRGERNFLVPQNAAAGYWKFSPNTLAGSDRFLLIPQPVRDPGTGGPQAVLDTNTWNTGQPGDFGDYTDLQRNSMPVLQYCTACTIEIVDRDGNTHTADGSATTTWASPGAYVDGRSYVDRGKSPSIVRLRFTQTMPYLLANTKTTVQSTFSFSASAPQDASQ